MDERVDIKAGKGGGGSSASGVATSRGRMCHRDAQSSAPCDEIAYRLSGTTNTNSEKTTRFVAADGLTGAMQGASGDRGASV